jgi:hypothetical protein
MPDPQSTASGIQLQYCPSWLTWVASTTSCLRALGLDVDTVEVAGQTGYAFHLSVARGLCPSGPTAFDWGSLLRGVWRLGRATTVFQGTCFGRPEESEIAREQFWAAFEMAGRETDAGRPVVIWGAYAPEFAAAVECTDDAYVVKSFRDCTGEPQPPIAYDALEAPGGPYCLAFPSASPPVDQPAADRSALIQAVGRCRTPSDDASYAVGPAAYDRWIEELTARRADAGGNAYNAQCYAEGRSLAAQFLGRVAERNPDLAAGLAAPVDRFREAASAMARVAELFPFPGSWGRPVEEEATIRDAVEALHEAREAESHAVAGLASATERALV